MLDCKAIPLPQKTLLLLSVFTGLVHLCNSSNNVNLGNSCHIYRWLLTELCTFALISVSSYWTAALGQKPPCKLRDVDSVGNKLPHNAMLFKCLISTEIKSISISPAVCHSAFQTVNKWLSASGRDVS